MCNLKTVADNYTRQLAFPIEAKTVFEHPKRVIIPAFSKYNNRQSLDVELLIKETGRSTGTRFMKK